MAKPHIIRFTQSAIATFLKFICGLCVAWTFGIISGISFWLLYAFGCVKTEGYWNAVREVGKGRLILAPSHPSLLECFLIPAMFFPWYLVLPNRFFVWSMPDQRLFPKYLRWLYMLLRCIRVDRSNRIQNGRGGLEAKDELQYGTVVIHPEGGRTVNGKVFKKTNSRQIRKITGGVPILARLAGARILPVWVGFAGVNKSLSLGASIIVLLFQGQMMISMQRASYSVSHASPPAVENARLEDEILSA